MQYVFSMSSRMVTIAVCAGLLLALLLFLMGIEIGARYVEPTEGSAPNTMMAQGQRPMIIDASPASDASGDVSTAVADSSSSFEK